MLKSMSHCKSLLVLPFCKLNAREFGNKGKGKTGKRFVKTVCVCQILIGDQML